MILLPGVGMSADAARKSACATLLVHADLPRLRSSLGPGLLWWLPTESRTKPKLWFSSPTPLRSRLGNLS
jgi:hypothetical protein